MADPRNKERIIYPIEFLIWEAILIPLLHMLSMRQFRFESDSPRFLHNLNALAETEMETVSHEDTIAYLLERLPYAEVERLLPWMANRLIRMKALDNFRLYGHFLMAVDGSGMLTFRQRHCDCCLTAKLASGETIYYHHVLEIKLVTSTGFALSVATEFIENADPNASKQDCELKAFYRLAKKLKGYFPQLKICLLGDGLYPCKEVFDICRDNGWKFIFTLKSGSLPTLFDEFTRLKALTAENRRKHVRGGAKQTFAWVNELEHEKHVLSVFDCRETTAEGEKYFAWVTNFHVDSESVVSLANEGGRQRWRIENEGFNVQKNCGYNLEHAYSRHPNACKCFYFLLQIAHMISQLMVKGSLLPNFVKTWGSLRNFARRLSESLRFSDITPDALSPELAAAMQIRLNSS